MAGHKKITNDRLRGRLRRKQSVRLRLTGTAEKPRLSVFRSLKHIYIHAVDDANNKVIASVSDLQKDLQGELEGKKKKERAAIVGEALGKKLIELNVKKAVFDRNGYVYHGRVKEVADGARKAGLEF